MADDKFSIEVKKIKSFISFGPWMYNPDHPRVDLKTAKNSFETLIKIGKKNLEHINIDELVFCGFGLIQAVTADSNKNLLDPTHPRIKIRQKFCNLLKSLPAEKSTEVLDATLNHLRNNVVHKDQEFLAQECFHCVSLICPTADLVLKKAIYLMESMLIANRIDETERVCRALHQSIAVENFWKLSASSFEQLLSMYHVLVEKSVLSKNFSSLSNCLETTARKIIKIMSVDELQALAPKALCQTFDNYMRSPTALLAFGQTVKEIFLCISSPDIEANINSEVQELLLGAMKLKCEFKSFFACRYLTLLIDYNRNLSQFSSLKVLTAANLKKIKVSKISHEAFIEKNRGVIEAAVLTALKLHGCRKQNLNAIYGLLCVMLCTMPAAETNIMVVDILMGIQELMIDDTPSGFGAVDTSHVHAFIISLMTIFCFTTRAKSLEKYVSGIFSARHNEAPHLLPPLKESYEYKSHHCVGYKSELFFDIYEVRYHLWKLYRIEKLQPAPEFLKERKESKASVFKSNIFFNQMKRMKSSDK